MNQKSNMVISKHRISFPAHLFFGDPLSSIWVIWAIVCWWFSAGVYFLKQLFWWDTSLLDLGIHRWPSLLRVPRCSRISSTTLTFTTASITKTFHGVDASSNRFLKFEGSVLLKEFIDFHVTTADSYRYFSLIRLYTYSLGTKFVNTRIHSHQHNFHVAAILVYVFG